MKQKFYWTTEKQEELKRMWNNFSLYKLASYFHTTEETIRLKAAELGLPEYKSNRWTEEEENLLREYSKKYVTKTIAKKLGRSYLSVQKKAVKLGIELHSERDPWKKWMIDYLKDNINKKPIGEIQAMLGLSYHRIVTKCNQLGIEYVKESWTEEEISILRKYAQSCHYTELTKVLPRRSVGAISAKAYELGIETISEYTKLTDDDSKFVRDNWGKISATEIARQLKTSISVVYRYKKELGLPNTGQNKKWTPEVIEKIRKDAGTKTRNELAKKYKTSPQQISSIARQNNISLIDLRKIWTKELDNKLVELINLKLSIAEISAKMNIKASTIRQRINQLGIVDKKPRNPNHIWTEDQVNILKTLSNKKSSYEIAEILNKTEKQIYDKAKKLGILINRDKSYLWTEEETNRLLSIYNKYDLHIIAQVMDRSEVTIRQKAKELGLTIRTKKRSMWTTEEESKLIVYAKDFTIKEIAYLLNRSTASIASKLQYIGLSARNSSKFWTTAEIKQLTDLSQNNDANEIAIIMNKSYESIMCKLYELGLKQKNKSNRRWTEEETETLLELLTTYSTFEVAEMLGRSEESITVRAIKMGYDVDCQHRKWTPEEETMLSDLWGSESIEKIARKLNRTNSAIINRVYVLGLGSQISNNYEGLRIQDIADMFKVNRNTILTSWVALGLKLDFRKRSNNSIYSFVQISNLYDFLEKNQNIWDSRFLEKNILGIEPEWLQEKRKQDQELNNEEIGLDNLTKQQLLQAKKYFLDIHKQTNAISDEVTQSEFPDQPQIIEDGISYSLVKKRNNI